MRLALTTPFLGWKVAPLLTAPDTVVFLTSFRIVPPGVTRL